MIPNAYFGQVNNEKIDWRTRLADLDDDNDDDDDIPATPDVIGMLGFDPDEEEKVVKGGYGSGDFGHSGRQGEVGGSSGSGAISGGKINLAVYRTLPPSKRLAVLKEKLASYKYQYVSAEKQQSKMANLSAKSKQQWFLKNKEIGRLEGISNAMANKGWSAKGSEQRKYFHFAINLQSRAMSIHQSMKEL